VLKEMCIAYTVKLKTAKVLKGIKLFCSLLDMHNVTMYNLLLQ